MTPLCEPTCDPDCAHLDPVTSRMLFLTASRLSAHWAAVGDWKRAEVWADVAQTTVPTPPPTGQPVLV